MNNVEIQALMTCDKKLLELVLSPYKENCRYLLNAQLGQTSGAIRNLKTRKNDSLVTAIGQFSIPQSCYIASTNHFNSVEFNICYNQLMYYLVGVCIVKKIFPQLSTWGLDDFNQHKLTHVLISNFNSRFLKQMSTSLFYGKVEINRIRKMNETVYLRTSCSFFQNLDMVLFSEGEVKIVILNK